MNNVSNPEPSLSAATVLLKEHKYEEALPILDAVLEQNPSDQEAHMYQFLTVRILILRYYLEQPITRCAISLWLVAHNVRTRSASLVRGFETGRIRRMFVEVGHAAHTSFAKNPLRCLSLAVAGGALFTLLVRYMAADGAGHVKADAAALHPAPAVHSTELSVGDPTTSAAESGDEPGTASDASIVATAAVEGVYEEGTSSVTAKAEDELATKERPAVPRAAKRVAATKTARADARPKEFRRGLKTSEALPAQYEIRRAIPLRESPKFAASVVKEVGSGTSVNVLEVRGSWAKIQVGGHGITGFVRKEFLTAPGSDEKR